MTALRSRSSIPPPSPPTDHDMDLARSSSRLLAASLGHGETACLRVHDREEVIEVPISALRTLVDVLANMAEGRAVGIISMQAELTTQMAADMLNVSRPHLVSLIAAGEIECHKVGTHRRLFARDVVAYKQQRDDRSKVAMEALAKQAQELNLGY